VDLLASQHAVCRSDRAAASAGASITSTNGVITCVGVKQTGSVMLAAYDTALWCIHAAPEQKPHLKSVEDTSPRSTDADNVTPGVLNDVKPRYIQDDLAIERAMCGARDWVVFSRQEVSLWGWGGMQGGFKSA
jgi:hypothetical protein